MNDQKIMELIAKTPGIRAVQLAETFDVALVDVSASLRSLVDVGDLVKNTHFDDATGRQWQVYALSDEFRRSRTGKDLLVGIGNEATAEPPPEAVEAVKLSPTATALWTGGLSKAPTAPVEFAPAVRHGPTVTKVDRAIAYLREHGAATAQQLAEAMGLPDKGNVSNYIAGPRRRGEIVRDGDVWKLASGQAKPLDNVEVVGNVILATRDQTPVPAEVKAALTEMATAAVTELRKPEPAAPATTVAAPPKAYRCGIWSDGKVEIRKSSDRILLTQAELLEIYEFAAKRWAA